MSFSLLSSYLTGQPVLIMLILSHFIGDFILQSQKLADKKKKQFSALCLHLILVALPLTVLALLFSRQNNDLFFQVWLSHVAIDYGKYFLSKRGLVKDAWEGTAFLVDQALHLAAIVILYQQIGVNLPASSLWSQDPSLVHFSLQVLFLITVTKPVNILFKLFFSKYQVAEGEEEQTVTGAGALIGRNA